jgi:hypothetical protein
MINNGYYRNPHYLKEPVMVIKTYENGSELTGTGLAAMAGVCLLAGVVAATVTVKVSDWPRSTARRTICPPSSEQH